MEKPDCAIHRKTKRSVDDVAGRGKDGEDDRHLSYTGPRSKRDVTDAVSLLNTSTNCRTGFQEPTPE